MAGSLYATKFRGQRDRQNYAEGAGDAAALSRMATATRDATVGGFNMATRDRGRASRREQTLLHHQLRMQQDEQRMQHEDNIRKWARLALDQKDLNFRQGMAGRTFDEGVRQFNEGNQFQRDAMNQRGSEFDRRMRLDERDFTRRGEQFDKTFTEDQRRFNADAQMRRRAQAGQFANVYTPGSWQEYEKTGNLGVLKTQTKYRNEVVASHMNRLGRYGFDADSLRERGLDGMPMSDNGRAVYSDNLRRFELAYDHFRRIYPKATEEEIVTKAAKRAGVGKAQAREGGASPRPPEGARQGPDGKWYVQNGNGSYSEWIPN